MFDDDASGNAQNRIDVYGHICQMVNQFPGYALRIVRRIIREKKEDARFKELNSKYMARYKDELERLKEKHKEMRMQTGSDKKFADAQMHTAE